MLQSIRRMTSALRSDSRLTVPATTPRALDLAEIAERYSGLLYAIGHQYRLTSEEREDAVQSTWLALCQSVGQIRDPECIAGWLATTMRRLCTATYRHRRREVPASDSLDECALSDGSPDLADAVATRHATARLHQAVTRLPDRERQLIQLQLDPAQPGYTQISRSVPMPVGSIGPVRGRALRRLRTMLGDLDDRQAAI